MLEASCHLRGNVNLADIRVVEGVVSCLVSVMLLPIELELVGSKSACWLLVLGGNAN